MNLNEQNDYFYEFVNTMSGILLKKGNDYANEDRLSNFKLAGAITGRGALDSCMNAIATKSVRLGNLIGCCKKPSNESLEDTLIDMANYCALMYMLIKEGEL